MSIFKCTEEMPPKDNSPDVVRTALSMPEALRNYIPASVPDPTKGVVSTIPPRRGHNY
jgi:hypothetical protein